MSTQSTWTKFCATVLRMIAKWHYLCVEVVKLELTEVMAGTVGLTGAMATVELTETIALAEVMVATEGLTEAAATLAGVVDWLSL